MQTFPAINSLIQGLIEAINSKDTQKIDQTFKEIQTTIDTIKDVINEEDEEKFMQNSFERCQNALEIARRYGSVDGEQHKAWVIDQMCRALLDHKYEHWVKEVKKGGTDQEIYDWEVGIAP